MKKIAVTTLAAGAVAVAGLGLAPLASADPAPPVQPGSYKFLSPGDPAIPVTVAYDCGPSCFALNGSGRIELRFADGHWVSADGISTDDGFHLVNAQGVPAKLVPA
jgi:hypothetical protein